MRVVMTLAVLAGCLAAPPAPAAAQAEHRQMLRAKLDAELQEIARGFNGVLGVQVVDLTDGTRLGVNADLVFPQGSAIKIPILYELARQAERRPGLLRERRSVGADSRTGGSGLIRHFADGASALALEDLAVLMIVLSDNTATNILIDVVTMDSVNRATAALGLTHTRLQRKMIRPEASERGEENLSTPAEAAAFMARLARCELGVSRETCGLIRRILEIPKNDAAHAGVPGDVPVASKPGGIEGVATIWALVDLPGRPYAWAAMTNYVGTDGDDALRRISAALHAYFWRLAGATPYGTRVPPERTPRRP